MPDSKGNPLVHLSSRRKDTDHSTLGEWYRPACGVAAESMKAASEDPLEITCWSCQRTTKWRKAHKEKLMAIKENEQPTVGIPTIHMATGRLLPAPWCDPELAQISNDFSSMLLDTVNCPACLSSEEFARRNDLYTNMMSPTLEPGHAAPVGKDHDSINDPPKAEPHYQHDCEACIFLGRELTYGNDLYYCAQDGSVATVIARHGNAGPEYRSGLAHAHDDLPLALAVVRAFRLGLLSDDDMGQL